MARKKKPTKQPVLDLAATALANGFCGDLTKTPQFKTAMSPIVQRHREALLDIGYDPDNPEERGLCEWMAWHFEND